MEQSKANAIQHLASIFPSDDEENCTLWREYLPRTLCALRDSNTYQEETFSLYFFVGLCLSADRRFEEAIAALEKTYHWREQRLPEENHVRLASEHDLASAYLSDKQFQKSIGIFEHIVTVRKKTLAEKDHNRLTAEHMLAYAYLSDRRIKEAIKILEHVVTVRKETLAEKDHDRLASEHMLADAYLSDGRSKEAIKILKHVVAIKKTSNISNADKLISQDLLKEAYDML